MERINIYNQRRKKIGKIVDRHSYKKKQNEYDLSIQIWIMNDNGEIILTKRAEKMSYPNLWECTEGMVGSDETSLEAAIREVKEELGIEIQPDEIVKLKIDEEKECPKYTDIYFCKKNISLEEINLQQEECSDVKLVDEKEYNLMYEKGEMIPYLNYFYETYRKNQEYGIIESQYQIFINKEKKYLKGNLHTHTTKSDGKYSIKEVSNIYKEHQYDFIGITDHDVFCEENISCDIILLHGIEYSCIYTGEDESKGEYAHFCCFESCNNRNNGIYYYKNYLELQKDIDKLNEQYSLIQFNHPLFSKFLDNEFISFNGYNLIEIYNHKDFLEETGMKDSEQLIRTLLNHNRRLLVTAGDDFHGPYNKAINDKCFGGYIMVEANKDEQDIMNAIRIGKFYATTGPEILDYRIEGRVIKIKTSPVKNIIFYSNMRKCKNIFNENDKEITKGEYILQGEEFYIWTKIIDKNGKAAWTQPVYLNTSSYFMI